MIDTSTRIAITNLGKYNEGFLVFKWLDLPCDEDELNEAKKEIGINERYEEFFITDYESDLDFKISEYENIENLSDLIARIEDSNDDEAIEVIGAIIEAKSCSLEDAIDIWEENEFNYYSGEDITGVAEILVQEGDYGDIPEGLKYYIDYEAIGRDLKCSGEYTETSNGVINFY